MNNEAKLEQVNADIEALQENKREIEKQIKDSEVTYSIGDRFTQTGYGKKKKFILVGLDDCADLANLGDGDTYNGAPKKVENAEHITAVEFFNISGDHGFTRYWDARKGESC